MNSSNLLKLVAAVAFLAGCSTESRKAKDLDFGKSTDFKAEGGTNFRVDSLSVTQVVPAAFSSYGVVKKKTFTFKACLQDQMGGALIPDLKFQVEDKAGNIVERRTDIKGCLSWPEAHEYSHFSEESYFKLVRTVRAKSVYEGAVDAEVAFNPWIDGAGAIVDTRYIPLGNSATARDVGPLAMKDGSYLLQANNNPVTVNVEVVNFDFRGLDYDSYEVTKFLGLKVAHKYQIRIRPSVIRKTIMKAATAEAFVGGRFKVTLAIFKERKNLAEQYDARNLISVNEFVASDDMKVGTFVADAVIKFNNVADMSSRTAALVTFSPLDDAAGLGEFSFSGILKPGRLAALNLVPSTKNARALAEEAVAIHKQREVLSAAQLFKRESGFAEIQQRISEGGRLAVAFGAPAKVDLLKALDRVIANPKSKLSRHEGQLLCDQLFSNPQALTTCRNNPEYTLDISIRDFVESVNSKPQRLGPTTNETLTMNASFAMSKSAATSYTGKIFGTVGGSLSAGAGFDLLSWMMPLPSGGATGARKAFGPSLGAKVSASIGADYTVARTWTSADTESSMVSVATTSAMTAERNVFQFGTTVRSCVLVSMTQEVATSPIRAKYMKTNGRNGLIRCASTLRKKTATEAFVLLGQNIGTAGSAFSDSESVAESSWRMLIRGDDTAGMLYSLLKNSDTKLVLEKLPEEPLLKEFSEFYTIQTYPGLLSQ